MEKTPQNVRNRKIENVGKKSATITDYDAMKLPLKIKT